MYPNLSYFLHDIFGTPVDNWTSIFQTFGLFLVLAILSSAYLLYLELKRKAKEGLFEPEKLKIKEGLPATTSEIIYNAVFGFILGFKGLYALFNFGEFQQDAAGVILSAKGHFLGGIAGALLFAGLKYWSGQRNKLPKPITKTLEIWPHDRIGDITVLAAVSGLAGAKIFDILEHLPEFFKDPLGMLFSGGGLAIYGGLILGFATVYWYLKRKNIAPIHVMDAVAPALIIGYGVGRMGCHFSGDGDWGIVNELAQPSWWFLPDWVWSYDYPQNVLNEGVKIEGCEGKYCHRLAQPVFPTPIYEIVMAFLIGAILWMLRKRIKIAGVLFFLYTFLNGVERFFIEKIRVNQRYDSFFNLTQAEIISIGLMLVGIGGMIFLWQRHRKQKEVAIE